MGIAGNCWQLPLKHQLLFSTAIISNYQQFLGNYFLDNTTVTSCELQAEMKRKLMGIAGK